VFVWPLYGKQVSRGSPVSRKKSEAFPGLPPNQSPAPLQEISVCSDKSKLVLGVFCSGCVSYEHRNLESREPGTSLSDHSRAWAVGLPVSSTTVVNQGGGPMPVPYGGPVGYGGYPPGAYGYGGYGGVITPANSFSGWSR